jgi:hypothetical protein
MSTDTLNRNVDPELGSRPRSTDRLDESKLYSSAAQSRSSATTLQGPSFAGTRHFLRHFGEMFVAMMVGMMVLGGVDGAILSAAGTSVRHVRESAPEAFALVMAFNMTVGMTLWMRYRRHSWAMCAEMGGAMFAPAIVALVLFWCSAIHTNSVGGVEMAAMIPAMLAVMLFRRIEYSQPVHSRGLRP